MLTKDQRSALGQTLDYLHSEEGKSHQGYFGRNGWAGNQLESILLNDKLPVLDTPVVTASIMFKAHALCPLELSFSERMKWMADYINKSLTGTLP